MSCCDLDLQGSDPNVTRDTSSQYGDHFCEIVVKPTSNNEVMGQTRIRDVRTYGRTDGRTTRRLYAPPKFFGKHNYVTGSSNCVTIFLDFQFQTEGCRPESWWIIFLHFPFYSSFLLYFAKLYHYCMWLYMRNSNCTTIRYHTNINELLYI
jgi:hypothetical protein